MNIDQDLKIKVGDVIRPRDGSGMSVALHHLLWNGPSRKGFKPVRVLSIEGDMLAVVPLHWDYSETRRNEIFDDKVWPALSSIWKGNYGFARQVAEFAFWIHAKISNPIICGR